LVEDFPVPSGKQAADMNDDGNINSTDMIALKRKVLKYQYKEYDNINVHLLFFNQVFPILWGMFCFCSFGLTLSFMQMLLK